MRSYPVISIDTETTGVDFRHGALPFFVTIGREDGCDFYEWNVDPLSRQPEIPEKDAAEIRLALIFGDDLVLQNAKFDVAALAHAGIVEGWPWTRTYDTLLAGHLLASNQPHNLTDMASHYLGVDIEPLEKALEKAVLECRRQVQQARLRVKRVAKKAGEMQGSLLVETDEPLADWAIAEAGREDMPSAKEKTWKYDTWLPRAMAKYQDLPVDHAYWTVLSEYSNADSVVTLALWKAMRVEIERRGLWEIYLERLKVLPVAYKMESRGVTLSGKRLEELTTKYRAGIDKAAKECTDLATSLGFDLQLPKGASPNNSIRQFVFDVLKLPVVGYTDKGNPSLDKSVLEEYEATLPAGSDGLRFVTTLRGKRSQDTACSYMEGYRKFWREVKPSWYRLHPSLNPTGTDTLRWSSSNPNEQNISKKENFNLRYCFGPAPGREWWSLDAKNIELRIPAYESGEKEMVGLFERSKEPPYFGSYHLLIFDILHPEKFAEHGAKCKDIYESTWYQWTKNGNFAVTYGAVEESGTADRAYHIPGAQGRIKDRLKDLTALNQQYVSFANKHGHVETLPDRTVNPKRGYPLLCTRTEWGRILPTVPFNYHVQSTAMWWMAKAMVRVQAQLDEWNDAKPRGFDGHLVLQVHDELVLDFPRGSGAEPWKTNLPKIRKVKRLMEQGGEDLVPAIPTPVSVEYHAVSWDVGKGIAV